MPENTLQIMQERLKNAQSIVKNLGARRDKLVGDARVAESRVKQAEEDLQKHGYDTGNKTIEDMLEDRRKIEVEVITSVDTLDEQIAKAEAVLAEADDLDKAA